MFYKVLFFILSAFCHQALAAAKVNFINIDNDIVFFSTAEAKAASSPSCVVAATQQQYTISLDNETGRAMYALLITALAGQQEIEVASAQDCADVVGIERVQSINMIPALPAPEPVKSKSLKLVAIGWQNYTRGTWDERFCHVYKTLTNPNTGRYYMQANGDSCQCVDSQLVKSFPSAGHDDGARTFEARCYIEE